MQKHSTTRLLLLILGLLSSSACKKADPVEVDGVSFVDGLPYYHFTEADRQWFNVTPGTVWTFENGQGSQRRYTVSVNQWLQVKNKIKISGILSDTYKLVSYFDEVQLTLTNVDAASFDSGGRFEFYTDPTVTPNNQPVSGRSRLYANATWIAFGGTNNAIIDYYYPNGNQLNGPFQPLIIRGDTYAEVALFPASPRGQYAPPVSAASLKNLYYDYRGGLVRLEDQGGVVWDRVP